MPAQTPQVLSRKPNGAAPAEKVSGSEPAKVSSRLSQREIPIAETYNRKSLRPSRALVAHAEDAEDGIGTKKRSVYTIPSAAVPQLTKR